MKKAFINRETVEGRLYQHNLEIKTVKNQASKNFGTEFIQGTIDIATDEEALNVIPIHFSYVTETTSSGKKNATYGVLKGIIESGKAWITDGKDAALKFRVNTALGLNDFYNQDDQLISAKRNEGGFVNIVKDLAPEAERNTFDFDMVITSVNTVEADEERNIPEAYLTVRGAIFNFRKDLLPVELVCRDKYGISYFESLDVSPANPVFTEVRGNIISTSIRQEIKEESAFGAASVRSVMRTTREWAINWARNVEYDFGAEDTLTAEELKEAMQNREVYLAGVKKQRDDYIASRNAIQSTPATSNGTDNAMNVPVGGFNF